MAKRYQLEIIVFVSGAVLMILELVGSRVLAPSLGTSLYVWTALIGVVLGSLSYGYFLGGSLADKNANYETFARILLVSAGGIGFVVIGNNILPFISLRNVDMRIEAFMTALVLFAPASVFLGMISPYAVRLKMNDIKSAGSVVGNLYAISTAGSIFGTFFAGFFLIAFLGTSKICIVLSAIMVALSLLAYRAHMKTAHAIAGIIILVLFGGTTLLQGWLATRGYFDFDSEYNRIIISQTSDPVTHRPIRTLAMNAEWHSGIFLDDPNEIVFPYVKIYRLGQFFVPDAKTALMVGGGGYTYPHDFLRSFSEDTTMDVVEIDPAMTAIAHEHFAFQDNPRVHITNEDGRVFLNRTQKQYDLIFGDAFGSYVAVPYQLTTQEAVKHISDHLSPNGVVIVNIIGTLTGPANTFFLAEYRTFKSVFPQVYAFPILGHGESGIPQNIMLIASKSNTPLPMQSNNPEFEADLERLWTAPIPHAVPILTDDFAPVDQYVAKLLITPT